jgi:hypothetical protein
MQLKKTGTIGCLLVCAALGQTEGGLRARAVTDRYPPLAEQARIQGDVRLEANSGVVTLVSEHPLLAPLAINNAKTLGSLQGQTKLDMTYHFVIVDTAYSEPTSTTVKRGNAFERAILRVLGFKTEKVCTVTDAKRALLRRATLKSTVPLSKFGFTAGPGVFRLIRRRSRLDVDEES